VRDAFRVDLSRRGECLVASVVGEIDLASAPDLFDSIESSVARGADRPARVVVDLTEVSFLDSAGLNALVRLERVLGELGVELRLVSPADRIVREVLEITHLTETLRVAGSLDEALG
jgi:anti-anti-sigma factor